MLESTLSYEDQENMDPHGHDFLKKLTEEAESSQGESRPPLEVPSVLQQIQQQHVSHQLNPARVAQPDFRRLEGQAFPYLYHEAAQEEQSDIRQLEKWNSGNILSESVLQSLLAEQQHFEIPDAAQTRDVRGDSSAQEEAQRRQSREYGNPLPAQQEIGVIYKGYPIDAHHHEQLTIRPILGLPIAFQDEKSLVQEPIMIKEEPDFQEATSRKGRRSYQRESPSMLGISHLPELTGDFLKGKLPALTQRRERGSHHLGDLEYRKGKKPKKEWSSMVKGVHERLTQAPSEEGAPEVPSTSGRRRRGQPLVINEAALSLLTPEERDRERKRLVKMQRNRDSAKRSRDRKLAYDSVLLGQIKKLEESNEWLKQQIEDALEAEAEAQLDQAPSREFPFYRKLQLKKKLRERGKFSSTISLLRRYSSI